VGHPVTQPHFIEERLCFSPRLGFWDPPDQGGHHRVFQSAELGQEVVKLENKSDLPVPEGGKLLFRPGEDIDAVEQNVPDVGWSRVPRIWIRVLFPIPRLPPRPGILPPGYGSSILEDLDFKAILEEGFVQVFDPDHICFPIAPPAERSAFFSLAASFIAQRLRRIKAGSPPGGINRRDETDQQVPMIMIPTSPKFTCEGSSLK